MDDPGFQTPQPSPTAENQTADGLCEAAYYAQLDGNRVQCQVCFRRCIVPQGERGYSRNKVNIEGRYYTLVYSRPNALQIDPIEKEPSFHFWLGATIFCTGTASCNNRCKHCQNWHLSQRSFEEIEHVVISPEETVALAEETGWRCRVLYLQRAHGIPRFFLPAKLSLSFFRSLGSGTSSPAALRGLGLRPTAHPCHLPPILVAVRQL